MEIRYPEYWYNGTKHIVSSSIEDFTVQQLLSYKDRNGYSKKVNLEDKPNELATAFGRLLEKLLEKNQLNFEEFHDILNTEYILRENMELIKNE